MWNHPGSATEEGVDTPTSWKKCPREVSTGVGEIFSSIIRLGDSRGYDKAITDKIKNLLVLQEIQNMQ